MPLSTEAIDHKLKEVVAVQLGADLDEVTPSANLVDDLGADSLDLVEIVIEVEDVFEIEIDEDQAEAIKTYGDLVRVVEAILARP